MTSPNDKSIPFDIMHPIILKSLSYTYGAKEGVFRNESDFKMELFHQLAKVKYEDIYLSGKVQETNTCYLHSEGKCENGNPSKADLLICNPFKFQKFNYQVDYIIELKHKLYLKDIETELKKISKYKKSYKCIYIISAHKTNLNMDIVNNLITDHSQNKIIIIQPNKVEQLLEDTNENPCDFNETVEVVYKNINSTLELYAKGLQQYHGFYWCNYEHEENKKQTYPCEGDFVCQLYHHLRSNLPNNLHIISEVSPNKSKNRIDLAIISPKEKWCIPIDVKMNWDQFKHKYNQKTGATKTAEASLIIDRYSQISNEYKKIKPITIVIQGSLAQKSDKKERSMSLFKNAKFTHDLMCYNENTCEITKESLGKQLTL